MTWGNYYGPENIENLKEFETVNEILRKSWKIRKFMVEIFATGWPGSQSFADLNWPRTNVGHPVLAAASPRPLRQSTRVALVGPGTGHKYWGINIPSIPRNFRFAWFRFNWRLWVSLDNSFFSDRDMEESGVVGVNGNGGRVLMELSVYPSW